jgi:hypothetical protein
MHSAVFAWVGGDFRTMIHNLSLANLTDIREYLDVPIHVNEGGLILRDYLEMSYPDRHWNDIQEMVEAPEDDGVAYMEQHGGQKMNPKYRLFEPSRRRRLKKSPSFYSLNFNSPRIGSQK